MGQEEGAGDRSRLLAHQDAGGVRLITRGGYDFSDRFALAAAAMPPCPRGRASSTARQSPAMRMACRFSTCCGYQRIESFCVRDATGQAPLLAGASNIASSKIALLCEAERGR